MAPTSSVLHNSTVCTTTAFRIYVYTLRHALRFSSPDRVHSPRSHLRGGTRGEVPVAAILGARRSPTVRAAAGRLLRDGAAHRAQLAGHLRRPAAPGAHVVALGERRGDLVGGDAAAAGVEHFQAAAHRCRTHAIFALARPPARAPVWRGSASSAWAPAPAPASGASASSAVSRRGPRATSASPLGQSRRVAAARPTGRPPEAPPRGLRSHAPSPRDPSPTPTTARGAPERFAALDALAAARRRQEAQERRVARRFFRRCGRRRRGPRRRGRSRAVSSSSGAVVGTADVRMRSTVAKTRSARWRGADAGIRIMPPVISGHASPARRRSARRRSARRRSASRPSSPTQSTPSTDA